MKNNSTTFAHIAILVSNIMFGLNYTFVKNLLPEYMNGISLALFRVATGALLLGSIALLLKGWKVEKKDMPKLIISGVLGLGFNQILFMEGLARTSPIDAAIITTFVPIFVIIISAMFYSEKITLPKLIGIAFGASGAMLVIAQKGASSDMTHTMLIGNILIACSTLFYALYFIWVTPLMRKYNPMVVVGWLYVSATIILMIFGTKSLSNIDFLTLPHKAVVSLLFIAIGSTFIGYSTMAYSLTRLSPTTASIYSYSKPIIAMIAAVYAGQDKITATRIIATLMVLIGVIFITRVKNLSFTKRPIKENNHN